MASLLGIYTREVKTYVHMKPGLWTFTAVLLLTRPTGQTQMLSREYYSAINKNKILIQPAIWINFKHKLKEA